MKEVPMSTAKKIAHGYLDCTKSMLKNAVVNRRGKARYCGRLAVSGSYVADGGECIVRTTVILVSNFRSWPCDTAVCDCLFAAPAWLRLDTVCSFKCFSRAYGGEGCHAYAFEFELEFMPLDEQCSA